MRSGVSRPTSTNAARSSSGRMADGWSFACRSRPTEATDPRSKAARSVDERNSANSRCVARGPFRNARLGLTRVHAGVDRRDGLALTESDRHCAVDEKVLNLRLIKLAAGDDLTQSERDA